MTVEVTYVILVCSQAPTRALPKRTAVKLYAQAGRYDTDRYTSTPHLPSSNSYTMGIMIHCTVFGLFLKTNTYAMPLFRMLIKVEFGTTITALLDRPWTNLSIVAIYT